MCPPSKNFLSCPLRFQAGVWDRTGTENGGGRQKEGTIVVGFSLSDGRKRVGGWEEVVEKVGGWAWDRRDWLRYENGHDSCP